MPIHAIATNSDDMILEIHKRTRAPEKDEPLADSNIDRGEAISVEIINPYNRTISGQLCTY